MMKIEQKRLKSFYEIMKALVPECRLMINQDGWNTMAVDTANVAMVSVVLPKTQFAQFEGEEKGEIGLDLVKIKNALDAMHDPGSQIRIERQKGRVQLTDNKYTYTITPLDVSTLRKRPTPPNLNLPATITIDGKELQETIRALSAVSDKVRLTAGKDGLALSAEGGDADTLRKEIPAGDGSKLPAATFDSLFSLDYLKEMARAMKEAGTISLHMGQDHPVRFDFSIDGMECTYLLAPRISEGE
jgi:proliferating cell nuclear antigen